MSGCGQGFRMVTLGRTAPPEGAPVSGERSN
jgi:hypothetical protein